MENIEGTALSEVINLHLNQYLQSPQWECKDDTESFQYDLPADPNTYISAEESNSIRTSCVTVAEADENRGNNMSVTLPAAAGETNDSKAYNKNTKKSLGVWRFDKKKRKR